jgi:hypothetical protein
MRSNGTIRKVLTAALALTILLWAEAGLALLAGDQVMACHSMMMHSSAGVLAAADASDNDAQDSDGMRCCPSGPAQTPMLAVNHPPCCSVSNDAERPLAFLVSSQRTTPQSLGTAAATAGSLAPHTTHYRGESGNADAPRFVKPILELKTDLRI